MASFNLLIAVTFVLALGIVPLIVFTADGGTSTGLSAFSPFGGGRTLDGYLKLAVRTPRAAAGTFDGNAVHAATPAPRGPPPTRPLHSGPGAGAALLVPRSCGSHLTLFVF